MFSCSASPDKKHFVSYYSFVRELVSSSMSWATLSTLFPQTSIYFLKQSVLVCFLNWALVIESLHFWQSTIICSHSFKWQVYSLRMIFCLHPGHFSTPLTETYLCKSITLSERASNYTELLLHIRSHTEGTLAAGYQGLSSELVVLLS